MVQVQRPMTSVKIAENKLNAIGKKKALRVSYHFAFRRFVIIDNFELSAKDCDFF